MGTPEERVFEVVVLAAAFRNPRGRDYIVENFPQSVVDLYDAVVAWPEWSEAPDLTERALIVAYALREDQALADRYQADVDAGLLGFGAGEDDEIETAIREVDRMLNAKASMAPSGSGLLGGDEGDESWMPEDDASEAPPGVAADDAPDADADDEPDAGAEGTPIEAEPADMIDTVLNAELDGERKHLELGEQRTLTIYFDTKASDSAIASVRAGIPIPVDEESIDLEVILVTEDFEIPPFPQPLRLKRDGRSANRAHFDITPLHAGTSKLSVLVQVKGNFLQRLDMVFDVGSGEEPAVANYGRTAASASMLEERVATLHIKPDGSGFELLAPHLSTKPVKVWLTTDGLDARIESVREALLASVGKPENAFNIDLSDDERDALLRTLAFEGFLLYRAIFAGPNASPELLKIGEWLRTELGAEVTTLQVVSIGFPVPWPLIYLTDRFDAAPLSWDNFIGMRHVVEQIPMELSAAPVPHPTIESTPELNVRVLYNDDIDMPSKPILAQRTYWGARGVALTEGTRRDDLTKLSLAPTATDRVLYLYCHAVAKKDPLDSHLILTNNEVVTLGDLTAYAPLEDKLPGHPLVFLNACESGEMSPNFYDGFVSYFLAKGARGVIGTECKTPGYFASEWAKAFFDELFAGKPLGTVVLELRRRFLSEHNNPYGLLYGVYCDPDTVVAPALPSVV